ncbi:uncharacterized protein LOC111351265 isoform X2 [Spodoptera litura]|uniref:Uncharacterized protein LOC111351265 isoform X2 n=1 Tax=Spodoptera litura TaxID=69820 RepID=A0A9J7DVC3_SPOLT|nr:uncharacterized protein LOC111351265 isoform X2 [Spodoptera litura]
MDDTAQSRASDAAATRKRRSSILKSQRPARTPFSELEFNVATPTDTAKSRRVSFSRRTGVAEFVTNEATTTWKNFYEEHNKSLESSSNDSEANASRQPVGHLGKRIFDQQFEEVEAVDFIGNVNPSLMSNGSLNNINFTQQLASLDCTTDTKLTAPLNKFELSTFTEQQSKLFGNDFVASTIGENSGRIDVNFSNIQEIGQKDDLDEIERDLERGPSNMGCHGPFSSRQSLSEYIEVDLNMTHVARNDEDMSITDTIHSPVQDVSKSTSIDKKVSLNPDWAADKENIAVNPYVTPCEADNFAVHEEPNQVLVFDGKRLTLQPDKPEPETEKNYRQTLLPSTSFETPQRKTIVLNVNDDLPNFVDDMLNSKCDNSAFVSRDGGSTSFAVDVPKKAALNQTGNISMTQALPTNIISDTAVANDGSSKRRTIVFNESMGNISVTQSLPAKLFCDPGPSDRRRTVVYENDTGNISMTQAVPTNILVDETSNRGKRKTIVFEDAQANISITQALPSNVILDNKTKEKRKTIVFEDEQANISVTQALSSNVILDNKTKEKRKTIVFEDEQANISVTQSLPTNVILDNAKEKRNTIVFNDDAGNVSVTQALPANIMLPEQPAQERCRTIIYEDDISNISVTQALPTNLILEQADPAPERRRTVVYGNETGNISITQALQSNVILERVQITDQFNFFATNIRCSPKDSDKRRRTIVYENDTGNISVTQAIPAPIIAESSEESCKTSSDDISFTKLLENPKRTTIVADKEDDDVSMTEAVSSKIIDETVNMKKTIVFDDDDEADESMTLALSTNVFLLDKLDSAVEQSVKLPEIVEEVDENVINYETYEEMPVAKEETPLDNKKNIHSHEGDGNMSIIEAIAKVEVQEEVKNTVLYDNDDSCNMSITKPIPAELVHLENEIMDKSKCADNLETGNPPTDVLVYQTATANSAPPALTEQGDLKNQSVTSATDSKITTSDNKDCPESVEELDSEDVSLMHPRVAERSDQLVLKTNNSAMDVDKKTDDVPETQPESVEAKESVKIESGKSVLDALLDMSITEGGTEDKDLMTQLDSTHTVSEKRDEKTSNISSESMFYVTKDSEDDTQTDRDGKSSEASLKDNPSTPIAYKEDDEEISSLEKKIEELKTSITKVKDPSIINEFYERVVNSDIQHAVREEEKSKIRERSEIFKKANDTKELLDMISDFTERDEDEYLPIVMKVKGPPPVEDKAQVVEPKRLSFAPRRQSIVLSREDLLNNISMAQAALQKSRLALDDSECVDDTKDFSTASSKKADRTSNEVVKTLHFDDESLSENDIKADIKYSPLKKTAFGETSYMIESKAKVIPTYLKDVSDGIKELMLDLVKPMADNVPFDGTADKGVRKNPSTQSTQIQANLITSSQVDIDSELDSYPESNYESDKMSSLAGHTLNKSRSRSFRSPAKFTSNSSEKSSEFEVPSPRQRYIFHRQPIEQSIPSKVLVFDHLNPLNNILLSTMDYSDAHKYNPKKSNDTLCGSEPSRSALIHFEDSRKKEHEVDLVMTQFCVESRQQAMQGDGGCKEDPSMRSSNSRPISTDQSIAAQTLHVKDNEANTLIAMKGNKELLEASSSLTLVDDPLPPRYYGNIHSNSTIHSHEMTACRKKKSPVKEESETENEKLESTEELMEHSPLCTKAKKRLYSPNDRDKYKNSHSSLDVTPKPSTKIQKISITPKICKVQIHEDIKHLAAEKDMTELPEKQANTSKFIEKRSPKKEKKSPANITVQQLITEYHTVDSGIDKHLLDALMPKSECSKDPSQSDVGSNSLDFVSSFTSSKNLNAVDVYSSSTHSQQFSQEMQKAGKMEWHPELISAISSNLSDSDSGVNVVAKIDMLPFMGSHECEWESSSADTWSFRLLHGRLRLTARLAHRLDNATRTRVRGDTPVLDITVETVQHDKKNPVATMCVRFACETMRYMVSRVCRGSCCVASDIPPLLRRCAAVARVALRWGRAMHDAKLHLAYTMDNDGYLTLKVANIPLRSVWEVSMRVELVVDDGRAAPWPRAGCVRVARVVSDVPVHDHDVARALAHTPRDWGHAPRTIWRMFRYLKHKTRDDDLLLA